MFHTGKDDIRCNIRQFSTPSHQYWFSQSKQLTSHKMSSLHCLFVIYTNRVAPAEHSLHCTVKPVTLVCHYVSLWCGNVATCWTDLYNQSSSGGFWDVGEDVTFQPTGPGSLSLSLMWSGEMMSGTDQWTEPLRQAFLVSLSQHKELIIQP